MTSFRQQVRLDAPLKKVWELVGNPRRHPEWWPRVIEVRGERFDQGSNYAQVTRSAKGTISTTFVVERLEDMQEIQLRCVDTGTYARWLMTEAQGGTFVDAEFGIEAKKPADRIFAIVGAKPYFRRWLEQSTDALEKAAGGEKPAGGEKAAGGERAAAGRSGGPDQGS